MTNPGSLFNPYDGISFWAFLWLFLNRFWNFAIGNLSTADLVSDEIQIFVLVGVAASSALVGTFLVLRKMTMLANSLSHTILLGIVIAFIITHGTAVLNANTHHEPLNIQVMLFAALVMGLITAFLTEALTKVALLQEDASTGLVFTSLFALGIVLVTVFTRSAHIGTEVVMGNVDALHLEDCQLVYAILAINTILFFLFFKEYKLTTFDPALSRALGISPFFFNYLLMMQVSTTAIGAFRAVGVLMVLAFITGPVLMARLLTDRLHHLLFLSVGIGCVASIVGVALSRHLLSIYGLALSTGGLVVCVIAGFFVVTIAIYYVKFFLSAKRLKASL